MNELFITNQSYRSNFSLSLKKEVSKLQKGGISKDSITKYITALFDGINSQVYNTPIDLFIEDRIFNQWKEFNPIQFLSLLSLIKEGINATTKKEIVKITPRNILSKSKIFNLINAIHFKSLFHFDLIHEFKPSELELNQANELYAEFEEYRKDKEPAEEYELVRHWAEDLNLDDYFDLVPESKHRQKNIDKVIEEIENDPLGLNSFDSSQERKMKKFLKGHSSGDINMAVTMYMVDAFNYFSNLKQEQIKNIAFEIATIGTQGIDPNKKNYSIPSIKDSNFSGYKTLAYYYVSWAIGIPEMLNQLQMPFDKEYDLANKYLKL